MNINSYVVPFYPDNRPFCIAMTAEERAHHTPGVGVVPSIPHGRTLAEAYTITLIHREGFAPYYQWHERK